MVGRQARERLLDAAVAHAMEVGIAELSLRELAGAIGTSHRMLIYHFGSRQGLLVAVTREVEERQRAAYRRSPDSPEDPRQSWRRISHPTLWAQERLFFELYAQALQGRAGTEGFLDGVIESWAEPLRKAFRAAGDDDAAARADARLAVAVTRGLLLDLLATKDRAGVDEAFERYLELARVLRPK
jgi:AcrR family transcriptional regulator